MFSMEDKFFFKSVITLHYTLQNKLYSVMQLTINVGKRAHPRSIVTTWYEIFSEMTNIW